MKINDAIKRAEDIDRRWTYGHDTNIMGSYNVLKIVLVDVEDIMAIKTLIRAVKEETNVVKIIDDEIERIKREYVLTGKLVVDTDIGYDDLLRVDGAFKELKELKRLIKEEEIKQ